MYSDQSLTSLPVAGLPFTLRSSSRTNEMSSKQGMSTSKWANSTSSKFQIRVSVAPTLVNKQELHDPTMNTAEGDSPQQLKRLDQNFVAHARNKLGSKIVLSTVTANLKKQEANSISLDQDSPVYIDSQSNRERITPDHHLKDTPALMPANTASLKHSIVNFLNDKVILNQSDLRNLSNSFDIAKKTLKDQYSNIIANEEKIEAAQKAIHDSQRAVQILDNLLHQSVESLQVVQDKLHTTTIQLTSVTKSMLGTSEAFQALIAQNEQLDLRFQGSDNIDLFELIQLYDIKQVSAINGSSSRIGTTNGTTSVNDTPTQVVNKFTKAVTEAQESRILENESFESRKVRLENLPPSCKLKQVTPIIWGGQIFSMSMSPHSNSCHVQFLTDEGCRNYLESVKNGIIWPDDITRLVKVVKCRSVEEIDQDQQLFNAGNATRVVRLYQIPKNMSKDEVEREAYLDDRDVEQIIHGADSLHNRACEMRFASMGDARRYIKALEGNKTFSDFGITCRFARDPCSRGAPTK